jgi:hypothetical protein
MRRDRLGAWVAACVATLWSALYMRPLINPFTLDVAFRDDWAQHTLGWLFFRNARWLAFPLGKLPQFLHPLGTTVGYMDSIPLVALTLRPFSALLPADFQYLGLWIVSCSAALAFFGAFIARRLTPHWEQQALIGLLTAMAPSLIARIVHPALCAHAFIVCAFAVTLAPLDSSRAVRRALTAAFVLLALGSATHPYFAVMTLAIALGLPLRLHRRLGKGPVFGLMAGMVALTTLVLVLLGYLGGGMQDAVDGFGVYSANLNTLVNSMGNSRIFQGLPTAPKQYEGYSYLGAGVFFVLTCALLGMLHPEARGRIMALPWRRASWPLCAALGLGVFAIATPVRWGEHELLSIELYKPLDPLTQSFRSSGRFIWPLAYAFVVAGTSALVRAFGPHRYALSLTLVLAVALQAYDLDLSQAVKRFEGERARSFAAHEWSLADGKVRHLVLYPVDIKNACESRSHYRAGLVTELAYLAYRHRWSFNSGYAARVRPETPRYCEDLKDAIDQGRLRPDDLYVVQKGYLRKLRSAGATCGKLDDVYVCAQGNEHALVPYLASNPK